MSALVMLFVQNTVSAEASSDSNVSLGSLSEVHPSTALEIIRALQGVLAAITSAALKQSFSYIQWILISRGNGLSHLEFLALSSTTGDMGSIKLILGDFRTHTKLDALFRSASYCADAQ